MTLIKTAALTFALAASLGVIATSASAQTRAERNAAAREARAEAQAPYRMTTPRYTVINNVAGNAQAPNKCMTDDGYGRFDTCDH
jgi:hypothetical protein